jgi:hypothetical protein
MTTYIFIENATKDNYTLIDQDGHKFGNIAANGYYGLKLNYSPTFKRKYTFSNSAGFFTMWLGIDGEISNVYPNNSVHLEVRPEEYSTRVQVFPPPLITSNQVTACCHLYGVCHNKLLITPIDHIYSRVSPLLAPPVSDYVLRLDFHP